VGVVTGESAIKMRVTEVPESKEVSERQRKIQEKLLAALDEEGALKVKNVTAPPLEPTEDAEGLNLPLRLPRKNTNA
jgi:hypothetical protein